MVGSDVTTTTPDVRRCAVARWPGFLDTLLWLRMSLARSVPVEWSLDDAGDLTEDDIALVEHLPPPASGDDPLCETWRARHRYGVLYYRQGPGFVRVRDRRTQLPHAVYTLRGERVLDMVADTVRPASADQRLGAAGLVITRAGFELFLPPRLRFPPIPAFAV